MFRPALEAARKRNIYLGEISIFSAVGPLSLSRIVLKNDIERLTDARLVRCPLPLVFAG